MPFNRIDEHMSFPDDLRQAIEILFENSPIASLQKASSLLSKRYLEGITLQNEEELLAYVIVRLPATYSTLKKVFSHLPPPSSLLDLGAGPGTSFWAARETWSSGVKITAIEREGYFIDLGKRLGAQVTWIHHDLSHCSFEKQDWVLFGYSLGELPEKELPQILHKAWEAALKGIIVIEPGTPRGYRNVLSARETLVNLGGSVLAPCPHSHICPLSPSDWCHFSARVERSSLHRLAKSAELPFEDEKYSYLIVSKEATSPQSRVIRPPLHRSGHTILPLCTPTGLQNTTISRKQKELYKKAKKTNWGSSWG
jgi:ribosomal protein RSM22 (predicted rRNA methylase)